MVFIRFGFEDPANNGEWGCESQWVPSAGDVVWLYFEIPDEDPTGNEFLEATVVKRQFLMEDPNEVWVTVQSDARVPKGFIPDSPAWPSKEFSKRKRELAVAIENIREGTHHAETTMHGLQDPLLH